MNSSMNEWEPLYDDDDSPFKQIVTAIYLAVIVFIHSIDCLLVEENIE
jgi:hypothetical protein